MKSILLIILSISFYVGHAQDKNQFYALDANMNQTNMDSSKYILWIHEKEDSNWQWDYYYTWGPLVKSTNYADHDGTVPNGHFYIYNTLGNLDSTGVFDHGKKNGSFYKFRSYNADSIRIIHQTDYDQDSLIKFVDLLKERVDNKKTDSISEKESEFPGGPEAWYQYFNKNLNYPERAMTRKIAGMVLVGFEVNKTGELKEFYIKKSIEYSLDQEALKIVKKSGNWDPGIKNGVPVNTYKVQPIRYKLE